jgi:hypothetical protein
MYVLVLFWISAFAIVTLLAGQTRVKRDRRRLLMSMSSDRQRLEDLRCLYRRIKEIDMPTAMKQEVDHISGQLFAAAAGVDKVFAAVDRGVSLLLDIYAYVKTLPAADDG